jgi:hypothetical protein
VVDRAARKAQNGPRAYPFPGRRFSTTEIPHGLGVVGEVKSLDDFTASSKDNRVQARDKESGLPMWSVEVLDFDPQAREKTHRVKIASAVQPVPPDAVAGIPVRPVVLRG